MGAAGMGGVEPERHHRIRHRPHLLEPHLGARRHRRVDHMDLQALRALGDQVPLNRPQQCGIELIRRLSGVVPQQIDQLFHSALPQLFVLSLSSFMGSNRGSWRILRTG
jgi:hypothetical protein